MKSVDAVALRKNLGQYVNEAYYRGDEFIIKRAGRPVAALVPLKDLERLESLRAKGLRAAQDLWQKNKRVPLVSVLKDVEGVVRHIRRRR